MKHSSEVTIIVVKSSEVCSKISVIDKAGPVVLQWRHAPHHEQALGQPVAWNTAGEEIFDDIDDGEDDPVCQPLVAVLWGLHLQGQDRAVGGVDPNDYFFNQLSKHTKL